MRPLIILLSVVLSSCSDGTRELSGNYFLREEGRNLNDILNHSPGSREIPANILSYNFNKDFIIASQRPGATNDLLYTDTQYFKARDSIYYWLVVHHKNLVLGPLNRREFDQALSKYNVQLTLERHPYD
jgi:hypothetical protein